MLILLTDSLDQGLPYFLIFPPGGVVRMGGKARAGFGEDHSFSVTNLVNIGTMMFSNNNRIRNMLLGFHMVYNVIGESKQEE